MIIKDLNLIKNDKVNVELLLDIAKKPELFSKGEELFWDDPYISQKMLEAHLNPTLDAASRNHETIDKTVDWLMEYLKLEKGARVLDLGCGPGLYCSRFYKHGLNVTGMDYSRNSINYAKNYSKENNLDINYIYQNYLTLDFCEEFDAIFLIYCDFGPLSDVDRNTLLGKIHRALKPGGYFIFDVFTEHNRKSEPRNNWYTCESGFWRPNPHIVLEQYFNYEKDNVYLDQYTVIEENGSIKVYRIWHHYYSVETISQVLSYHNYGVQDIWGDLTGKPYESTSNSLGVVAKKI